MGVYTENKKPISIMKWETLADLGTDVTSFESDLGKKCELRTSFQCLGNFIDLKMGFELP
jgi:hypothetical protein